jgi:hypothetical protein
VCVRGASALADALAAHPGAELFVIWEPVLESDTGPPGAKVALTGDARVHRYWDPTHALSTRLSATKIKHDCLRGDDGDAVWDAAFVYTKGAPLDEPAFCGRPVVRVRDAIGAALDVAASGAR